MRIWALAVALILLTGACGPSDAEVDARIERTVETAIANRFASDISVGLPAGLGRRCFTSSPRMGSMAPAGCWNPG